MFSRVRLPARNRNTRKIIKETVFEVFGVGASVKLSGSRINNSARGGDIDLLVKLPSVIAELDRKTVQCVARLQLRISESACRHAGDRSFNTQKSHTRAGRYDWNQFMISTLNLPVMRFLQTLEIVVKEGCHLPYSLDRLLDQTIVVEWVAELEQDPARAEQMEAFISRFGRMQDTMADKLFPRWLVALAAVPGSQIEMLKSRRTVGRFNQQGKMP